MRLQSAELAGAEAEGAAAELAERAVTHALALAAAHEKAQAVGVDHAAALRTLSLERETSLEQQAAMHREDCVATVASTEAALEAEAAAAAAREAGLRLHAAERGRAVEDLEWRSAAAADRCEALVRWPFSRAISTATDGALRRLCRNGKCRSSRRRDKKLRRSSPKRWLAGAKLRRCGRTNVRGHARQLLLALMCSRWC